MGEKLAKDWWRSTTSRAYIKPAKGAPKPAEIAEATPELTKIL